MRKLITTAIFCLLCLNGFAQFRIWEDREGNQYNAEFVRELFDKVTLRTQDDKEIRMTIDEFCDNDQKYFRVMVPPNITIETSTYNKVKPKAAREPFPDYTYVTRIAKEAITISKKSKRPFTNRLYIEVFLIAEEIEANSENYVLLGISKGSFLFTEQDTFTFKTKPAELVTYTQNSTSQRRGEEYIGYIYQITLKDNKGETHIVETSTDLSKKIFDKPELLPKLRDLMDRGSASKRCRHFNKNGERVDVPRVKHFRISG